LESEIPVLREHQTSRAANDPDFRYLLDDVAAFRTINEQKTVSLNLDKRTTENKSVDQGRLERENARRTALGLPTLADVEDLTNAELPEAIVLRQAARVVAEMVAIEHPKTRQLLSGSEAARAKEAEAAAR
jgi:carboxyl-terminal processing protease